MSGTDKDPNNNDPENLDPVTPPEGAGGDGGEGMPENVTPIHGEGGDDENFDNETPDRLSPEAEADPRTYEELYDECIDLKDRLLRAIAETENLRRRAQREKEDAAKYAITAFARDMVEVQDNMIRALASISPEDKAAGGDQMTMIYEGVEMTQRSLQAAFERHKIEILNPAGEKFDPNFHQAVAEIPGTDHPAGTVVDVMQTGYSIGDRLLRPAMVTVAKGHPGGAPAGGSVDTSV
jgi:molecular chaperone GrpE